MPDTEGQLQALGYPDQPGGRCMPAWSPEAAVSGAVEVVVAVPAWPFGSRCCGHLMLGLEEKKDEH